MNKTTAVESNRLLLIAITLIVLTGIIIYLYLALATQQPLNLPWQELASVGWVSEVVT